MPTGGQSRSSQLELNKFLSKIKQEINGAGSAAITENGAPKVQSSPIQSSPVIPKVLLSKVSPLEQQLLQMRGESSDAPPRSIVVAAPSETVASGALKLHNDALRKDSVMASASVGKSRIQQELEMLKKG